MTSATIIGAGWAGLAAGVELSRHNIPVTVYESAKQVGGRARDVSINHLKVDNGQHLMIGAYHQLLEIIKIIGADEEACFLRQPQHLLVYDAKHKNIGFEIKLPRISAPLHLVSGILSCRYLSGRDKINTLIRFNRLLTATLSHDMSVTDWLNQTDLPTAYVQYLLKPLCLAALTTHPDLASARCFQTVLQQTFLGARRNTDLLIPKVTLGKLFPDAAVKFIEAHGGKVLTEHKVSHIDSNNKILTVNSEAIAYDQLIIATPAWITADLLQSEPSCDFICQQLAQLQFEPVTTVYLQYSATTQLPLPMVGSINSTSEWIFDRRYCHQPGLMAVVISAHGQHLQMNNTELTNHIKNELAGYFPTWPAAQWSQVIREKRACFQSQVDMDKTRPTIPTPISNILLCGDYVYIEENNRAGLPATLEGAVRSGVQCAQYILNGTNA